MQTDKVILFCLYSFSETYLFLPQKRVFQVRVLDLTKEQWSDEDVLILGSDGLWDVVSNDKAAEIVRNTLKQPYEQGNEK